MSKPVLKDLPELVKAGIITPYTAQKITEYYQLQKDTSSNRFNTILGIPGSLLAGGGIGIFYQYHTSVPWTVSLHYPFEEFCMDEYKAPKAETIYRRATGNNTQKTNAQIKMWKGKTVIENVFIGNTPIEELFDR